MIELVAFLGNYGREYEKTRHNVAWYFEDSLPFARNLSWQSKFKGEIASLTPDELSKWACDTKICSTKEGLPVKVPEEAPAHIYFLKPMTYMNLSGEATAPLMRSDPLDASAFAGRGTMSSSVPARAHKVRKQRSRRSRKPSRQRNWKKKT